MWGDAVTVYTSRTTIACPQSMLADANALALALGESAADDQTFRALTLQDASGNLYAVASTVATDTFATRASSPLTAPAHAPDADLAAAGRAQAALVVGTPDAPSTAAPDTLTAILGASEDNALDHIAAMGLTRVPHQDEPI